MTKARIRNADVDDAPIIAEIFSAAKLASLPALFEPRDRDMLFLTSRWRGYIAHGSQAQMATGDGFVLIAELDDRPVGYAAYHHTKRHKAEAELESIYILEESQGKGVGTSLLREIAHRLVQEEAFSMCVGYDERNPYKRFYAKHGAVEINPYWAIWNDVSVVLT